MTKGNMPLRADLDRAGSRPARGSLVTEKSTRYGPSHVQRHLNHDENGIRVQGKLASSIWLLLKLYASQRPLGPVLETAVPLLFVANDPSSLHAR